MPVFVFFLYTKTQKGNELFNVFVLLCLQFELGCDLFVCRFNGVFYFVRFKDDIAIIYQRNDNAT